MRVAVFGFGAMGQRATRMLLAKGAQIVAVIDPAGDLPQRVSRVFGQAYPWPQTHAVMPELEPLLLDVALHTFATQLVDIEPVALACAAAGVNVASIAEDAFEPFFADAHLPVALRLDSAFREARCTLLATGVQDTFMYQMPLALISACEQVRHVRICNIADLSKLGPTVMQHLPINARPEDCRELCDNALNQRFCFDVAIRPLIRRLGRTVISSHNELRLLVSEHGFYCAPLQLPIEPGCVYGLEEFTRLRLDDGSQFELALRPCVLGDGQQAYQRCDVDCASPISFTVEPFDGAMLTCAALVSRALELADAPRGFISVDQLEHPGAATARQPAPLMPAPL